MTNFYGSFDGYWDAVRKTVVLPAGVPFEDFKSCPTCYQNEIEFSPSAFFAALETDVIKPMRDVQELIDSLPYVTRLYSTMSAAEMTVDPLFSFNAELDDVSNIHSADRVIECGPGLTQFSAPWRIELPQGGVIRGSGQDAQSRSWPAATAEQPPNRRIVQLGESGDGDGRRRQYQATRRPQQRRTDCPPGGAPGTGGTTAGGGGAGATTGVIATGGLAARPSGGAAPMGGMSATTTGGSTPPRPQRRTWTVIPVVPFGPGRSNAQGGLVALLGLAALGGLLRRRPELARETPEALQVDRCWLPCSRRILRSPSARLRRLLLLRAAAGQSIRRADHLRAER